MTDLELRFYVATVLMEARGEGVKGMAAVAWVIKNRALVSSRSVIDVVLQPFQFSCWNSGGKHRARFITAQDSEFRRAQRICIDVWSGAQPDITNGALWYHADYIDPPSWTKNLVVSAQIGRHIFYAKRSADDE